MNYPLTLDMEQLINLEDLVSRNRWLPFAQALLGLLNILHQGRKDSLEVPSCCGWVESRQAHWPLPFRVLFPILADK
jgi:hypothetical protein